MNGLCLAIFRLAVTAFTNSWLYAYEWKKPIWNKAGPT